MKLFVVLLIAVFLFVGGQMLLLRPSERERQLARLREAARKQGMTPHVTPRPDWLHAGQGRMIACYELPIPSGVADGRVRRGSDGGWMPEAARWPGLVQDLPAGVHALDWSGHCLRVFWDETGPDTVLALLAGLPDRLSALQQTRDAHRDGIAD